MVARAATSSSDEPELRQVCAHGGVELDVAALDETHDRRRRERLGDRTDLEERVRGDVERMLDAGDAERRRLLLTVEEHAERSPRHRELLHLRSRDLDELFEVAHAGNLLREA